ncbi:sodium calcium [Moniliophthora roreri MCA 2997]|uniref:Sodium calcium n=1 Tax=Moniliophthora roreri (strain MCA 2997) TaxID=1381753 RepID=V2YPV7_MONRO|nr:sodium calcium [Moniliophthora roreri MCA 2997]
MSNQQFNEKDGPRQRTAQRRPDEEAGLRPAELHAPSSANSREPLNNYNHGEDGAPKHHLYPTRGGLIRFKDQFLRKGKRKVGTLASLSAIAFSSWLNVFIVFIPLSWVAHFNNSKNADEHFPYPLTFTFDQDLIVSLLAIIPLEKLFDYGGEQMAFYVGKDLGDLIVITLNNTVEATLAIILLTKCEIRLLQSTIIGVVVLHLLLIPGTAFIVGGARLMSQDLHPHITELNHTLLTMGVLSLLLPAAFFAALDRGSEAISTGASGDTFLKISRGFAIILLVVYVCSRIFLHNPPGEDNALQSNHQPNAPLALKHEEEHLTNTEPEVNQWVCIGMLIVTIALMAVTAEWLVDSIEFVREEGRITEEWFGLILLPIVSFAADGMVAIGCFVRWSIFHLFGRKTKPGTLAKARAIDLSIQFTLFWMPFFVLLGWWTNKPLSLLFDLYEVAVLIGSCFLVNYVTADAKTNWAEGLTMVAFYLMIALTTWFYRGKLSLLFALLSDS